VRPTATVRPTTTVATLPPQPSVDYRQAPRGPVKPTGATTTAKVTRIVDGDTIHVDIAGKDFSLRYIGMDAPESVKPGSPVEPFAREATKKNTELVGGRTVILERDVSETDRYGRLLRDVWLKAGSTYVLVDFELVLRGYARVTTFPPDVKYVDQLLAAERWARQAGVGLWSLPATTPTPSPTKRAAASRAPVGFLSNCDPSYPDRCIPPPPPDLDCADIGHRVRVLPPDPHHLDGDHNGFACEAYPP
jgi:micrococcal nuclease